MPHDTQTKVTDLLVGNRVDLEDDPFADADPEGDFHQAYAFEYQVVESVVQETPECTLVHFMDGPSVGFPTDHVVTVHHDHTEQDRLDECYWEDGCPLERGRCDTCGAPCNEDGCTRNPSHTIALEA